MRALLEPLRELASFEDIRTQLHKGPGIQLVTGCIDSQKAHLAAGLAGSDPSFTASLLVCATEQKALEMTEEYRFYRKNVYYFPARDLLFFEADISSNELTKRRMETIKCLLEEKDVTVVTTIDAFLAPVPAPEIMEEACIRIRYTDSCDLAELEKKLARAGYARETQVEAPGQFAVRGGILDVFALTEENPWRVEFWGDDVDSIRVFDAATQRSLGQNVEEILIYPAAEVYAAEAERGSFLDYFGTASALLVLDEPNHLVERCQEVVEEYEESVRRRVEKDYMTEEQAEKLYTMETVIKAFHRFRTAAFCMLDCQRDVWDFDGVFHVETRAIGAYVNSFEILVKDLAKYRKEKYRIVLMSGSRTRAARLADDLQGFELPAFFSEDPERTLAPGEIMVTYGKVYHGFEYPLMHLIVIAESDIFGKEQKKRKKQHLYSGEKIRSFQDLKVGDYVVHESHGLGIYRGIEKMEMDHVVKDYMKIEYAKGGNLYIPATGLDLIQKYSGAEGKAPKLNRLGGQDWERTKTRVRGAVKEIAGELVQLYAVRQGHTGFVYGPDTVWQREFEELFEYEETDDQLQAIEATKRDMESDRIMDRLICGDVGFGKTEVALRAAFKAVQESKQVVVLVPTTILAQQHYNTFVQRMKDFPVRIDLLCRFRTTAQQKKTLEDLEKGQVDIVIGTHRLLSKDVKFRDLGLLVIDEEQRFGVAHKEKIKQMKQTVDVLALSATPIPRTLHMSLTGIRDMSVLEEAPTDRMPIQTYVLEYNEETVREAIHRELSRGGQVYYVYNRVDTIAEIAGFVQKLVPDANVAFAHGQMSERELERIMVDFINGEIDVLISTTIIETGLDIPNVNTILIHDADNMGLSQLYQLRGRVGRSNRTAYAFLMYRRNKLLREVAEKRLKAIREFTELGSGIKIAMRDLEIRGAGNLLGASQHGHMEAVGYDLYCKMLNDAVRTAKGMPETVHYDTEIDLFVDAFIPESYIQNEFQKLDIYKRIAGIESEEERQDMEEELLDRFGDLPKSVENLLQIAVLKARAHELGLVEVSQKQEEYRFVFFEKADLDPTDLPAMLDRSGGDLRFRMEPAPTLIYKKLMRRAIPAGKGTARKGFGGYGSGAGTTGGLVNNGLKRNAPKNMALKNRAVLTAKPTPPVTAKPVTPVASGNGQQEDPLIVTARILEEIATLKPRA